MATTGFDIMAAQFTSTMKLSGRETLDLFWGLFLPTVQEGGSSWYMMIAFGLFTLYMIFLFQLFKSFFGPLTQSESPIKLTAKTLFFGMLVVSSVSICSFFFEMGTIPFKMLAGEDADVNFDYQDNNTIGTTITDMITGIFGDYEEGDATLEEAAPVPSEEVDDRNAVAKVIDWALTPLKKIGEEIVYAIFVNFFTLIIVFSILLNYLILVVEIAERYIILGVLSLFSPLCIATGASEATNNVFKSWVRVMISQCILMCLGVFFLKVFTSAVTRVNKFLPGTERGDIVSFTAKNTGYTPFVGMVLLLAWLRTGQRVDSHMGTLGLTAVQAGNGLFFDMMAGQRVMKSTAGAAGTAVGLGLGLKAAGGNIAGLMGSEYGAKKFGSLGKAAEMYNKGKAKKGDTKNSVASAAVDSKMLGKSRGAAAMSGIKDKFGDTKIGKDGNKSLNDLMDEGSEMLGATMTENGGVADMIDKDGNKYQVSFGETEDGNKVASAQFDTTQPGFDSGSAYMGITGKGANEDSEGANGVEEGFNGEQEQLDDEGNLVTDPNTGEVIGASVDGDSELMEDAMYGTDAEGNLHALATDEDGNAIMDEDGNYVTADGNTLSAEDVEAGGGVQSTEQIMAQANADNSSGANITESMKNGGIDPAKVKQDGQGGSFVQGAGGEKVSVGKVGDVDNLMQSGIQGGKALNTNGKMADISSSLTPAGTIDPSKVKQDSNGNSYVTAKDGSKVPVNGKTGQPTGFQQMLAKNNMAAGFDGKVHDVSGSVGADGRALKDSIKTDGNGDSYINAVDGAKIPVDSSGNIQPISGGIGGGMAMGSDGQLHDISSSLDASGGIDAAAITPDGNGGGYVTASDGTQIGVNMATGELLAGGGAGYSAGSGFSATAIGADGQAHDITGAIDQTTGEISQAAIFQGEDGGSYISSADGTAIPVDSSGGVEGLSVSESIQTAGIGSDGAHHDITGSIDASTGLIDPSAVQSDANGSFVNSSDGVRVPVDTSSMTAQGMTTNADSYAAVADQNTGQVQDLSSHTKSSGGLGLNVMSLSFGAPGGSGSSSTAYATTGGSSVGASVGYTPTYGGGTFSVGTSGSVVATTSGARVDASLVMSPTTGSVNPSAVSRGSDGGYYASTPSGETFAVQNHGSGIYTPVESYSSYSNGAGHVNHGSGGNLNYSGIKINNAAAFTTTSMVANETLATGYSSATGHTGSHVQVSSPAGESSFREISQIGGYSSSGDIVRYNSMGQPDHDGQYARVTSTSSASGYELAPIAGSDISGSGSSGISTYDPASASSGQTYVSDPSRTGEDKYRPIHSSGFTSSGGVQRYDENGNPSSSGSRVRVDDGAGGYEYISPSTTKNGMPSTYQAQSYFGGEPVDIQDDNSVVLKNGSGSSLTSLGDGLSQLQLREGSGTFSMVPSYTLGSAADNFPSTTYKGVSMRMIPDTAIAYNGNTKDLMNSLRGTSVADFFSAKIPQSTNNFVDYGTAKQKDSSAAAYVKTSTGYTLANKAQMSDNSIPKYAQEAQSGGYLRSRTNNKGVQKLTNAYYTTGGTDVRGARNLSNGKVAIISNNVTRRSKESGDPIYEGAMLVPASGNFAHTIKDSYAGDKGIGAITKGNAKYYVCKAYFDKDGVMVGDNYKDMFNSPHPKGSFGAASSSRAGRAK